MFPRRSFVMEFSASLKRPYTAIPRRQVSLRIGRSSKMRERITLARRSTRRRRCSMGCDEAGNRGGPWRFVRKYRTGGRMHEGRTASPIALPMRALAASLYGSAGSLSVIHCLRNSEPFPLAVRREVSVRIFESACHWAPPFVPSS